jgi:hypothetical protein
MHFSPVLMYFSTDKNITNVEFQYVCLLHVTIKDATKTHLS